MEKQNQAKGLQIVGQAIQCKSCVKGAIEAFLLPWTFQDSHGYAYSLLAHCLLRLWRQVRLIAM